jgi:hypothetical protein
MSDKKHDYRADRKRLEALLDNRVANTPVNVSGPMVKDSLPNRHASGFNAGGEARRSIGEINQHNED